jgi:hypothetical protein
MSTIGKFLQYAALTIAFWTIVAFYLLAHAW